MVEQAKIRKCTWCGKPMGNSWHKSANGNYIHIKCVNNFKSYFVRDSHIASTKEGMKVKLVQSYENLTT